MAIEFTSEEEELTRGMPLNIAVGFIAARRGTDVRSSQEAYKKLMDSVDGLKKAKMAGKVSDDDLRNAFEDLSKKMGSREQS